MMRFFFATVLSFLTLTASSAWAQVQLSDLKLVSDAIYSEYGSGFLQRGERLYINNPPPNSDPNFWWNLDTAHASYSSYYEGEHRLHFLFLMGGYARQPGMTRDGVAATLCHELGHGIGGPPFKDRDERAQVSVEGQSDYFAYRSCLFPILKRIPEQKAVVPVSAYTDGLCREAYPVQSENYKLCTRAFQILEVERFYFKATTGQETFYETPDPTVVSQVELQETYYPPAQCRLDTMMAGILARPRPACWYVEAGN